ncbi:hypothetical protein Tco_0842890 [Tanacetum coccineum]|uniref:Uncharacterized protein n=1 Tax=Tanacetum coccineum TaxID=301880 RepID=A0ABQ5B3S9_9ASTR
MRIDPTMTPKEETYQVILDVIKNFSFFKAFLASTDVPEIYIRVIKKKDSISVDDNIIPEPYIALELGKSISLIEATKEEAARQVHATHERIVTESDPEPTRRRPSEQLAADTMQALKASRKSSRRTGAKLGVPDKEKVTSKAKADVYSDEDEEKKDDDDDDKSINIEETSDEENDEEFVRRDEHVQENVDEEMKDAEGYDTGNGDEEITNTAKADAEKTGKSFGNQFLNLSSDKSTVGTLKDFADAEINSLLDVQIQQEIPQIQSSSIITVPVLVIFEPAFLSKNTGNSYSNFDNNSSSSQSVKAYLGSSLGDALQKSVQANIINEVKKILPKFLPKAVSDFATLAVGEHELKIVLFNKMDKSHSYLTHDKQQALYDALFNSLSLDDASAHSQADLEKTLRKRDRDDEDPLAKPNQVNDVDQPLDDTTQTKDKASKYDWFKQPHRPPTLDPKWNKRQVVDDQPKQSCFNNMVFAVKDPLTFDERIATPIDFSKYG